MTEHQLSDWLPASKVARELDISAVWVRQLMSKGRLASIPTPLGRLVDPASVEAYKTERAGSREPVGAA